jgi:hypothetical protein
VPLSQSVAARVSCAHVPSTGARLARRHRNYLPNTAPPPTGTGENDLPFRGVEMTQLHLEAQYASWAC